MKTGEFCKKRRPSVVAVIKNYLDIPFQVFNIITCRKGVIFDLDGTLVDMEEANYQMYLEVLKRMYGLEITKAEWQKIFTGRRP